MAQIKTPVLFSRALFSASPFVAILAIGCTHDDDASGTVEIVAIVFEVVLLILRAVL